MGLYLDGDVKFALDRYRGADDDFAGGIRDEGIGYVIDNDGDPVGSHFDDSTSLTRALAAKFLASSFDATDTSFNWWVMYWRQDTSGYIADSFGPRERPRSDKPWFDFGEHGIGRPAGRINRFYMMATPEWDYDQVFTKLIGPDDPIWLYPPQSLAADVSDGYDTRFLLSLGSFELPPDSSVRVLFSTFTADSVIYRTDLDVFLSILPEFYDQVIDLPELARIGKLADSLATLLLDPEMPVEGLRVVGQRQDTVFLQWDAWGFENIDGYNLYVVPIDSASLPHPQLPAPWLRPPVGEPFAVLGQQSRYALTGLDPYRMYAVYVAHRTATGVGRLSAPVLLPPLAAMPAPQVRQEYTFSIGGAPAALSWQPPSGVTVDHYCVYRFPDTLAAADAYHAFYDLGWAQPELTPRDSFVVDTLTYYFYEMTPYAVIPGSDTSYFDYQPEEGTVYVLSAVDVHGYETAFSEPVQLFDIPARTKDILVVTNSNLVDNFVSFDTVKAFYDSVLRGYDYDIVNYFDSSKIAYCHGSAYSCLDWKIQPRYRLVIYDDGLEDQVFNNISESEEHPYSRALQSGTALAVFGSMVGFTGRTNTAAPAWYPVNNAFLRQTFGIDSVYYTGFGYYAVNGMPSEDTLLGFVQALPVADSIPAVTYDTTRYPFTSRLLDFWPPDSPPSVAMFKTD
ncbi:MAG: fibronectin type III domain-containing protein, partial [Candidatus Zixiibacteriota bacterium]